MPYVRGKFRSRDPNGYGYMSPDEENELKAQGIAVLEDPTDTSGLQRAVRNEAPPIPKAPTIPKPSVREDWKDIGEGWSAQLTVGETEGRPSPQRNLKSPESVTFMDVQSDNTYRAVWTADGKMMTAEEYRKSFETPAIFEQQTQETQTAILSARKAMTDIFGEDAEPSYLLNLADTDPDEFLDAVRKQGRTADSENLLKQMFPQIDAAWLDEIFGGPAKPEAPLFDEEAEAIRQYGKPYDELRASQKDELFRLQQEKRFEPAKQALISSLTTAWFDTLQGFNTMARAGLPKGGRIYGPDTPPEGLDVASIAERLKNEQGRLIAEKDRYFKENPQLTPPVKFSRGVIETFQNDPDTFWTPEYLAFVAARSSGQTLASLGVGTVVTFATGNPFVGALAAGAAIFPSEVQNAYDMMKELGVSEDDALRMSLLAGGVVAAIEQVSDIPFLKGLSSSAKKLFTRSLTESAVKLTIAQVAKSGIRSFGRKLVGEMAEEVAQDASTRYFASLYVKDTPIFKDVGETMLATAIATAPFAVLGMGTDIAGNIRQGVEVPAGVRRAGEFAVRAPLAPLMGTIGAPAEIRKTLPSRVETQAYKTLQEKASKFGLDFEAVQGIGKNEYWVAISPARKADAEAFNKWSTSLPKENIEFVTKHFGVEYKKGLYAPKKGTFAQFTNLDDARKFMETGDKSLIANTISLKGDPWSPANLKIAQEALAEQTRKATPRPENSLRIGELQGEISELGKEQNDLLFDKFGNKRKNPDLAKVEQLQGRITNLRAGQRSLENQGLFNYPLSKIQAEAETKRQAEATIAQVTTIADDTRPSGIKEKNEKETIKDLEWRVSEYKRLGRDPNIARYQRGEAKPADFRQEYVPIAVTESHYAWWDNLIGKMLGVQQPEAAKAEVTTPERPAIAPQAPTGEAKAPEAKAKAVTRVPGVQGVLKPSETAALVNRLTKEIDDIVAVARARMDKADKAIVGLRPAETDWMTTEELTRLDQLKQELPKTSRTEARERVAAKREARKQAAIPEPTEAVPPTVRPARAPLTQAEIDTEGRAGRAAQPTAPEEPRIPSIPEAKPKDIQAAKNVTGTPSYTKEQADAIVKAFGEVLTAPSTANAREMAMAMRRATLARRLSHLQARAEELYTRQGKTAEEAIKQATTEAMAGNLPDTATTMDSFTGEIRDALFSKVYNDLKNEPTEMLSTVEALTNALAGKTIPMKPGTGTEAFPEGGSAYKRLLRVFSGSPGVVDLIEKGTKENRPFKDVVEAEFREVIEGGNPPVNDPSMGEWLDQLEKLSTLGSQQTTGMIPPSEGRGKLTFEPTNILGLNQQGQQPALGETGFKPPSYTTTRKTEAQLAVEREKLQAEIAKPPAPAFGYEAPINEALKIPAMFPAKQQHIFIRALKEAGMTAIDIGNALRASKASADFSWWRQQTPLIFGNLREFIPANIEAWKAFWSDKSADASWLRITRDPIYQIYDEIATAGSGRDFLRPLHLQKGTKQWGVEEYGYLSKDRPIPAFILRLPWVATSQRSFVTGTNEHNWAIFKKMYRLQLKVSEKIASGEIGLDTGEVFSINANLKDQMRLLADMTGRGGLGEARQMAKTLSAFMFAPRYKMGRLLTARDLFATNPYARKEAWRNVVTTIAVVGGIALLGEALKLWDVEKDPRSTDAWKLRIGNTRFDLWGGYQQLVVLISRLAKSKGISSITGEEYDVDAGTAFLHFLRSSASPLAAVIADAWTGKTFTGEKVNILSKEQWIERLSPIVVQDIYEAFQENWAIGLIAAPAAFVGIGVQTYTGDWKENIPKLGTPKYTDNMDYGLNEPRYDFGDLWADTASQFTGVNPETLTEARGYPSIVKAIVEGQIVLDKLKGVPNLKLSAINADPTKGTTFDVYRKQWLDREKIVASGDKDALEKFDADERTRDAQLGNMTNRQFALLQEYHAITDKAEQAKFLEGNPEIALNPYRDYLVNHPEENALLALGGKAKVLTQKAYDAAISLIKKLDIPDSAVKDYLPPAAVAKDYFSYQDAVEARSAGSAEAKLIVAKNDALRKYLKLKETDTPIPALELVVKNRAIQDKFDGYSDEDSPLYIKDEKERAKARAQLKLNTEYGDDLRRIEALSNNAISIKGIIQDAKKAHEELLKPENLPVPLSEEGRQGQKTQIGNYDFVLKVLDDLGTGTINDAEIDKAISFLEKNMASDKAVISQLEATGRPNDYPTYRYLVTHVGEVQNVITSLKDRTPDVIEDWVERGRKADEFGGSSAEVKVFMFDHPSIFEWALSNELVTDDGADWNIPALRITAKRRKEDAEYQAILDANEGREESAATKAYLDTNDDYRKDRRRRDAYKLKNSRTGMTLPASQVENYVAYNELPLKGFRRERMLVEDPNFAKDLQDAGALTALPNPSKVPAVQYDDIFDKYALYFDEVENNGKPESDWFEPDEAKREARDKALRFDKKGRYTDFGLAELERNAYGKFIPTRYSKDANMAESVIRDSPIKDYAGYYKILGEGKPKNWTSLSGADLPWYDDDWFLIDHPDFYKEVYLGVLKNERRDYRKVPTKQVFAKYLIYLNDRVSGKPREDYRWDNPDLDAWGVLAFGWKPIKEQSRKAALTPQERLAEEVAARLKRIRAIGVK